MPTEVNKARDGLPKWDSSDSPLHCDTDHVVHRQEKKMVVASFWLVCHICHTYHFLWCYPSTFQCDLYCDTDLHFPDFIRIPLWTFCFICRLLNSTSHKVWIRFGVIKWQTYFVVGHLGNFTLGGGKWNYNHGQGEVRKFLFLGLRKVGGGIFQAKIKCFSIILNHTVKLLRA